MNFKFLQKNITIIYVILSIILFIFTILYINKTTNNVIFMDEPRFITTLFSESNINIHNLWAPSANGSQRSLGYYLILLANTKYFGLNVQLNMYIGSFFILLSSILFIKYFNKKPINYIYLLLLPFTLFSLNKWEYLTIGSSMPQFMALFGFYLHFFTIDNFYIKNKITKINKILLNLLPSVIILLFAGGYSALYAITILTGYLVLYLQNREDKTKVKQLILNTISIIIPIIIYSAGLLNTQNNELTKFIFNFFQNPIYYIKFFFISLTGPFVGIETITKYLSTTSITFLGVIIFLLYLSSIYVYFFKKIYKETFMPLLLIIFSIFSSIIMTYARSDFGSIIYGASSRYSTVSEMGIIGIIIIYAHIKPKKKLLIVLKVIIIIIFLIYGTFITTKDELVKSPYRLEYFKEMEKIGLNYENETDKNLEIFQSDASYTREALKICQKNKWNIFKHDR